jgi:putative DNA methylase
VVLSACNTIAGDKPGAEALSGLASDAIFACLGPALEIFSRYSRVEKASGETVSLKEYLQHI